MIISETLRQKMPGRLKYLIRILRQVCRRIYIEAVLLSPTQRIKLTRLKKMKTLKLNIGCGKAKLSGWINIDIEPGADLLVIDIRRDLPFNDNSVDFIYCEHVLEHFSHEVGEKIFKEFERCLKGGGVVRVSMPDLDHIVQKYHTDWKDQDWLSWPGYEVIETRGQMINAAFRWWGHKYLYNEEDLKNQLIRAGFGKTKRCEWNKSTHAGMSGLETRKDSRLIVEATKG